MPPLAGRLKHGQGGEIGGFAKEAKRPPRLDGRVANDVLPAKARSAVMPPPTNDTKEPYRSSSDVWTSPSNTIRKSKGQSPGPMRPQGPTPHINVSKTPKASGRGKRGY
jgi:hypothetical protein